MHESNLGNPVRCGDASGTPGPVLLYDGLCGFCDRTVRFLLRHDAGGAMRFAPLGGETAAGILARHPALRGIDSLVLADRDAGGHERVRVRSDAVIASVAYLGGGWHSARALRLIPRVVRDAAYDAFARFRYRLFGRFESCPAPPPGVRDRFLP